MSPMLVEEGEFELRRDIAPNKMSDVFARQCSLGFVGEYVAHRAHIGSPQRAR